MNIYVGNLAFTATEQDLRQLFEPYGAVDKVDGGSASLLTTMSPSIAEVEMEVIPSVPKGNLRRPSFGASRARQGTTHQARLLASALA